MYNLLTEPLLRIARSGREQTEASLPEVYAALLADTVEAFPALRPHQRHAWHAFLVQLGAMAMHRAGLETPPETADDWADIIRRLTPDWQEDEPWQLVVDDITKPAFMQPPARTREREADFKTVISTPDNLDMLVTSKNHDLKARVAEQARPDDWIFALVTLQTMDGFVGAGNYGISRMNSGFGNRPAFSLAPWQGGLGRHVQRDIKALLEFRPAILNDYQAYPDDGGISLLWALPWDGERNETLLLNRFDPLYIEICRRIRLKGDSDGISQGLHATSKAARIEGRDLKGRTGDPWTPVNRKRDGIALTLSAGGFNYKRVADYIGLGASGEWGLPPLFKPTAEERRSDKPMQLVARAMVRGNGKTEGYYERVVVIGHKGTRARGAMQGGAGSRELGEIAQARIKDVGLIQTILSHSIQTFMARGDSGAIRPEYRTQARPWLNQLDEIVDATFFDDLQTEFEAEAGERQGIRHRWLNNGRDGVIDHARNQLRGAMASLSCPSIHRYKAQVGAEGLFESRLRGNQGLPELFKRNDQEEAEE